jgi:hypothetical protein
MQEATTFNIFYDGLSFQHLATVIISVFTLRYGPGLLFRGPPCTTRQRIQQRLCIRLLIHKEWYGTSESPSLHVQHSRYTTNIMYNQNMETASKTKTTTGRLLMNQQAKMDKYIHVGIIN